MRAGGPKKSDSAAAPFYVERTWTVQVLVVGSQYLHCIVIVK